MFHSKEKNSLFLHQNSRGKFLFRMRLCCWPSHRWNNSLLVRDPQFGNIFFSGCQMVAPTVAYYSLELSSEISFLFFNQTISTSPPLFHRPSLGGGLGKKIYDDNLLGKIFRLREFSSRTMNLVVVVLSPHISIF